ncbi:cell division cycle 6 [Brevipalpus obovatus]|uniref:cell division cycle 6 n=1 Tax=Brevipalpus obovatus TaxID=246614 RepID=UPI003D9F91C7
MVSGDIKQIKVPVVDIMSEPGSPKRRITRYFSARKRLFTGESEQLPSLTKKLRTADISDTTPWTSPVKVKVPPPTIDHIGEAKRLLSVCNADNFVGREKEREKIHEILENSLKKQKSASLYVSGPPGTGKTASLTRIISELRKKYDFTCLIYNSMDFNPSKSIYSRLANDLGTASKKRSDTKLIQAIERMVLNAEKMVVLLLDEIDGLLGKEKNSLLKTIFDWPRLNKSKLILIGVTNIYDLTERTIPELGTIGGKLVRQISFAPYKATQIEEIVKSRLGTVADKVFDERAIRFCAKSVASHHGGDLRKALDYCRRALELVERESKNRSLEFSPLKATSDDGLNPGSPRRTPRKINAPIMVGIAKMSSVMSNNIKVDVSEFTFPQKTILLILITHCQRKGSKEIDIVTCHQICTKVSFSKTPFSTSIPFQDFFSICQILEAKGLIRVKEAKEARKSKLSLMVNEDELLNRMKDQAYVSLVLQKIDSYL